jgi:oligoendopeptidase F
MTVEEMRWDLSQLVDFDDPGYIEEQLTAAVKMAEEFKEKHRGKITGYSAKEILALLEESDERQLKFEGPFRYAFLSYAADMTQDVSKNLFEKAQKSGMLVNQATAFMDLELGQLISKNPDLIEDPVLSEYKHKLERIQRRIPHMLPEEIEQTIIMKDLNGIRAWNKLFGDWLATRTFQLEIDGEMKTSFLEIG